MSIRVMLKQLGPSILSYIDENYEPEPHHLFPVVVVRKMTPKEIEEALKGKKNADKIVNRTNTQREDLE